MKTVARAMCFAATCLMLAVSQAADPQIMKRWTAFFAANDPEKTAETNHSLGKHFIFGAMGAGAYYPGLEHAQADFIKKTHKVIWIPETTDAISGDAHMKYVELAESWAKKYNQRTQKLTAP